LKVWLDEYIDAAGLQHAPRWRDPENGNLRRPLFPTALWGEKRRIGHSKSILALTPYERNPENAL
jgi:hypothetical protein